MTGEEPMAWGVFVGLTTLFIIFHLRLKIVFICSAIIITASAILAMLITMEIIPALEDWQIVFTLGRYAFFSLLSALVLIIIRHIREGGEDINRGGQKEED